ncbi:MAG: hydrogenase maturation protein, partial [Deltaproteobacteria bacterium]
MRILFLTHAFNSLTQRLYCELTARGHQVSIEFDIADSVAEEAVALFAPGLVVAPYLRRAIPESIWRNHTCLIVHPGIVGDRGPSSLDRAIQRGEREWGVTVLQATAEMDAGPIWAAETFTMRAVRKSSVYRNEVVDSATRAVLCAVDRFAGGEFTPTPLDPGGPSVRGRPWPAMSQGERAIDWSRDTTREVVSHIHAADGFPGVADTLFGEPCRLFDATGESALRGGSPGEIIARRETALLRATVDGAAWLGHVKRGDGIKLPATVAFADRAGDIPPAPLDGWWTAVCETWQDIRYEESGTVGFLHFGFYNGAMSTSQCRRLLAAYEWACARPTKVIALMGGADHWSNGIHLHAIEAAASPADESWANIEAMNDLARAIICTKGHVTIAALQGGCGAGGCYLARATDLVWGRAGALLNPHYKGMGNLFGSEYWTYLLPPRVGVDGARAIMQNRLPM